MRLMPEREKVRVFLLATLALLLVVGAVLSFLTAYGHTAAENHASRYLRDVSQHASAEVDAHVDARLEALRYLGCQLPAGSVSVEELPALLQAAGDTPFDWVGVVDDAGALSVPGKGQADVSSFPEVARALSGRSDVSSSLARVFQEDGVLYCAPRASGGAVAGWIAYETARPALEEGSPNGIGRVFLVSREGDLLQPRADYPVFASERNLFKVLAMWPEGNAHPAGLDALRQGMAEGREDVCTLESNGMSCLVRYEPLRHGGWYLVSVAAPASYMDPIEEFTQLTGFSVVGLTLLLVLAFGSYLAWVTARSNRDLRRMAFVDPATGGSTAALFDRQLEERIRKGEPFSLVALDIRQFRLVNDTFGKDRGDRLLRYAHDCIVAMLRPGEHAARISADVFNLALLDTDRAMVAARLHDLALAMGHFTREGGMPFNVQLKCGVCAVDGTDQLSEPGEPDKSMLVSPVLLRDHANVARKSTPTSTDQVCSCAWFDDQELARMLRRKELEDSMTSALESGEFFVMLQPKVDPFNGCVVGAEALARWNSAKHGMVPPDEFIPLFERNGSVVKLDLFVYTQVCRFLRDQLDAENDPVPVSVNLSPAYLYDMRFADDFAAVQAHYRVPSHLLEFELTERLAADDLNVLRSAVEVIHQHGCRCSLDDFGSGYSSLNVLKEVSVDVLKIDRQFFVNEGRRGRIVVQQVVELANNLGMYVVAEGVETESQIEFLRKIGCDAVQGYIYYEPLGMQEFAALLNA